ncbi:MAG: HPr-rel-A system PqqD family peptide chaperone [Nitrosomonas sp.]|nr:HPr-rel-A system PqqD family peptide chaperone [Nitrosomonas sp.]
MHWQSNLFNSLLIEDWGEEYTVFQPDSGKTHFLNQMSMQILEFLDRNPATTEKISAYLAEQFQQEPNHNFLHNIEKILYHFDTLGLINKVN